jgi:HD-GYP domain-containing protein (c-di-GMP phosphodiesterase class II)
MEICHRSGFDDEVCRIVLSHHERYDGNGYPDGLAHPNIPYPVRIVSVMDTFDALTSARDYRERLSVRAARALIARGAGTKFCPWVVSGLLALPVEMLQLVVEDSLESRHQPEGLASLPFSRLDGFQGPNQAAILASRC